MLATLLLGIFIGSLTVMFALENTSLVTISFFGDQVTAPLAAILLLSVVAGILITLVAMLPRFIRDALDAYAVRREQRREAAVQYETSVAEQKTVVQ